ncbi:MAG: hypothetical protein ACO3VQ_02520 [Ilumatobacteraceae bacterium]
MPFPFTNGDVLQSSDLNALNRMPPNDVTTSTTLALTDEATWIAQSGSGNRTLTIPPNSSVAFPLGAQILVSRSTANTVTIAQGSGVTLYSTLGSGNRTIANVNGFVTLIKYQTDVWYIMGDVA